MERAARLRFHRRFNPDAELPYLACWGCDCPFEFGEIEESGLALPGFVWSRKERLYLLPKSRARLHRQTMGRRKERALNRLELEKLEQWCQRLTREKGRETLLRHLKQEADKYRAQEEARGSCVEIKGERARARCPLCSKVSILFNATGARVKHADRQSQPNNGHLEPSFLSDKRQLEPP